MKKKIAKFIHNILTNKKKYRELRVLGINNLYNDRETEHITLDDPQHINILTRENNTKGQTKK